MVVFASIAGAAICFAHLVRWQTHPTVNTSIILRVLELRHLAVHHRIDHLQVEVVDEFGGEVEFDHFGSHAVDHVVDAVFGLDLIDTVFEVCELFDVGIARGDELDDLDIESIDLRAGFFEGIALFDLYLIGVLNGNICPKRALFDH